MAGGRDRVRERTRERRGDKRHARRAASHVPRLCPTPRSQVVPPPSGATRSSRSHRRRFAMSHAAAPVQRSSRPAVFLSFTPPPPSQHRPRAARGSASSSSVSACAAWHVLFVKQDAVMVLATRVTAATRMLAVLACVWQRGDAALSLFDTERTAVPSRSLKARAARQSAQCAAAQDAAESCDDAYRCGPCRATRYHGRSGSSSACS